MGEDVVERGGWRHPWRLLAISVSWAAGEVALGLWIAGVL